MNEQPKSKVLIIIIGSLLIANIVMLAFFLMNEPRRGNKKDGADSRAYVKDYLQKEVGFNAEQMARYDTLSQRHREQVKAGFKGISEGRKTILSELAAAGFSDSAIDHASNNISDQQKGLELNMLKHLKEIRSICTEEQRRRFDTGFYKIFRRHREMQK